MIGALREIFFLRRHLVGMVAADENDPAVKEFDAVVKRFQEFKKVIDDDLRDGGGEHLERWRREHKDTLDSIRAGEGYGG